MRIFFARHGESEANVLRVISNRDVRHPLTDRGRQQAEILAECLAHQGIVQIYSSPILRAAQTAECIAARLGVPVDFEDGLREFDCGVFEGRSDEAAWAQHSEITRRWYEDGDLAARLEGGESFEDIKTRFLQTLSRVQLKHRATDQTVLCLTHGALLCSMLPIVVRNLTRDQIIHLGLGNAIPIETVFEGENLKCLTWGDQVIE